MFFGFVTLPFVQHITKVTARNIQTQQWIDKSERVGPYSIQVSRFDSYLKGYSPK